MNNTNSRALYLQIPENVVLQNSLEKTIELTTGSRKAVVRINTVNDESFNHFLEPVVLPNETLARSLLLQPQYPLGYKVISPAKIQLGPIVGVLTTKRGKNDNPLPVGKQSRIYKEMVEKARVYGILLYFFYPSGINWSKRSVSGFIYYRYKNDGGRWVRSIFPMPNVVYNRIYYRAIENQKEIKYLLKRFNSDPNIQLFNTRFLNKWEVYNSLNSDERSQKVVPETRKFSRNNLFALAGKYQELFIKPINNSIGKGIIKVQRTNQGYIFCTANSPFMQWIKCRSIDELYRQLKARIMSERNHIIQKAIDLATIDGRLFDLRTQAQKNGQGKWVQTGVGIRVAAPKKFVTHIPNGGSRAIYEDVVNKVFGTSKSKKDDLNAQLNYICTVVPKVLEDTLGLSLGVLSIDVGLDRNGVMWIIEINSKPASFDENDIRERHLSYLNEYFRFVSDFR